MNKVLVVDDEENIRLMLKRVLSQEKYEVEEAENGLAAIQKISQEKFNALLLDLKMPKMSGLQVINRIKELEINIPIIMMSAYGTIPEAVNAMKLGAFDYLVKPFDLDELKITLKRIIQQNTIKNENLYYREEEDKRFNFKEIIGQSAAIEKVLKMIKKVAPMPTTVLLTGESGTGKELVARAIHKNSTRKDKPFVVANCVALSSNILESELFGHEKGAFTGANSRRIGRFEISDGGTIFLDEIGEVSLFTQAKLLRAVQEKEFERVGSSTTIKVDTRIVAATNKDLQKEVAKQQFRDDLFYRLNVFQINIPPLKERKEDIPLLVNHFIKKYNQILNKRIDCISKDALSYLMDYSFPGNIRELENIIERSMIMCSKNVIEKGLIDFLDKSSINQKSGTLKDMEKEMIKKYLVENNGNKTKTAIALGISRRSLQSKIKEYKFDLLDK
ncbi:MAG: sigma-54 dependent transcriptional regulator [Candidatus Caldatribacteriota bacterium]|nr:sigma-54 dependent transcriptional regulator [Atribacterota bacterium]MDD3030955.1 sigma-54 dependent transcriptional regulator [Atribacterota bacterium]MDD3640980.1 sigma-54 dependent transcriptional regulator [Atribacterota bacterium]MDD4289122.1 sigma-54 dependent transcriptional regulator [Atribacterota bacterium]MDD4764395.1 sigma-54 dependent transcriptional regulator [Atribacterota bacterium]